MELERRLKYISSISKIKEAKLQLISTTNQLIQSIQETTNKKVSFFQNLINYFKKLIKNRQACNEKLIQKVDLNSSLADAKNRFKSFQNEIKNLEIEKFLNEKIVEQKKRESILNFNSFLDRKANSAE